MKKSKSPRSDAPSESLLQYLKFCKPGQYPLHEGVASEETRRIERSVRMLFSRFRIVELFPYL